MNSMNSQKQQSVEVAVVVPFLQAVLTGVLFGFASGVLAWFFGWDRPGVIGLAAMWVGALLTWMNLLARWKVWVEAILGVHKQESQPPAIAAETQDRVKVAVVHDNGRYGYYLDLPVDKERLTILARGILQGQSFSENSWIGSRGPFSRSEFYALRDELIKRGLARWVNPRAHAQGVELTAAGRALIRRFATHPDTPLLKSYPAWDSDM